MSRLTAGIFVAIGLSLVSGAAQFALGRDIGRDPLLGLRRDFLPAPALQTAQRQSLQTVATGAGSLLVNRQAKSIGQQALQVGRRGPKPSRSGLMAFPTLPTCFASRTAMPI